MSIYRMTKAEQREFETLKHQVIKYAHETISEDRDIALADLMAFLGIIHNSPSAKRDWIEGR